MTKISRLKDWSDLDLDFFANPSTGDVSMKKGIEAIKRSIRNLVLTNYYDRKFQSYIGSGAVKLLFENINQFTAIFLRDAIIQVIENFEPRARLVENENRGVTVVPNIEENGYNITIDFIEINRQEPNQVTLFLERLR